MTNEEIDRALEIIAEAADESYKNRHYFLLAGIASMLAEIAKRMPEASKPDWQKENLRPIK